MPAGRFAQYRATLATTDPAATPELLAVTVRYQTVNLAPEIAKPAPVSVTELTVTAVLPEEVRISVFDEVVLRFTLPKSRVPITRSRRSWAPARPRCS